MSFVDDMLSNIRMLAHYLVVAITNKNDDMTTLICVRSSELRPTSLYLFITSWGQLHLFLRSDISSLSWSLLNHLLFT